MARRALLRGNLTEAQSLFQGGLKFFVPQAVDQGVDYRGEDSVHRRDELVGAPGIDGLGPDVHEDHGRVEDGDHGEVGGAGDPWAEGILKMVEMMRM